MVKSKRSSLKLSSRKKSKYKQQKQQQQDRHQNRFFWICLSLILVAIIAVSIQPLWNVQNVFYPQTEDEQKTHQHICIRFAYGAMTAFGVVNTIACVFMLMYLCFPLTIHSLCFYDSPYNAMTILAIYFWTIVLSVCLLLCMLVLYLYYRYYIHIQTSNKNQNN